MLYAVQDPIENFNKRSEMTINSKLGHQDKINNSKKTGSLQVYIQNQYTTLIAMYIKLKLLHNGFFSGFITTSSNTIYTTRMKPKKSKQKRQPKLEAE